MKYEKCIICGLEQAESSETFDLCVSSQYEAVCERCFSEYQEELAEKALLVSKKSKIQELDLPF